MNDPIAVDLARLSAMPLPPALDRLEAGVFAAIEDRARGRAANRTVGLVSVAGALAIGLAGGGMLGSSESAVQAATPIGIDATLAPSTLLLGR